ncbi:unnamed protein product [Paramecium primaurelia]|uniref:Uncharacterized protein n=1 Tax=Paramecium primaurelia TaxID=5886 RepID=A0A8S1L253_PARPR|nr:unnamed protein product [Paramecium primaurelia]
MKGRKMQRNCLYQVAGDFMIMKLYLKLGNGLNQTTYLHLIFKSLIQVIIKLKKKLENGIFSTYFIGGGLYDQENQKKISKMIDLSDEFSKESQVTYVGKNQKGNKVGRWNIQFKNENVQIILQIICGGGQFSEENSIKIGKWVEVIDNFGAGVGQLKVTYNGEYNYGKKVGMNRNGYR